MEPKKNVLIITSPRENGWMDNAVKKVSKGLHEFIENLNHGGDVTFAITTLDKIEFCIENGSTSIYDSYNKQDLSRYDLVHFRNVALFQDYARAITHYMAAHGKQVFEGIDTIIPDYGKLSQMVLFGQNGIGVPNTWACWDIASLKDLLVTKNIQYPFILKANNGIKGQDNYLVKNEKELDEIIATSSSVQFVAQQYIPNDGDYRVLYFADEPLVFKRTAAGGSHLNNTSQGGSSAEIAIQDFDTSALELAKKAAKLTQRTLAGVDVIQHSETGDWFILEVNANPALSSGTLLGKKVDGYRTMIKEIL